MCFFFYRCYAVIKHARRRHVRCAARHDDNAQRWICVCNRGVRVNENFANRPGQVQVRRDRSTRTVKRRPFDTVLFVRVFGRHHRFEGEQSRGFRYLWAISQTKNCNTYYNNYCSVSELDAITLCYNIV